MFLVEHPQANFQNLVDFKRSRWRICFVCLYKGVSGGTGGTGGSGVTPAPGVTGGEATAAGTGAGAG